MAADYCKHSNSEYEVVGGYVPSPRALPWEVGLTACFQISVARVRRVQGMFGFMTSEHRARCAPRTRADSLVQKAGLAPGSHRYVPPRDSRWETAD